MTDDELQYLVNAIAQAQSEKEAEKQTTEIKKNYIIPGLFSGTPDTRFSDIVNYFSTIEESFEEKISTITKAVFSYKGMVSSIEELPEDAELGDCYAVNDVVYAWNGSSWDNLNGTLDLSEYLLIEDFNTAKAEILAEFANYVTTNGLQEYVTTALLDYATKTDLNNAIAGVNNTINTVTDGINTYKEEVASEFTNTMKVVEGYNDQSNMNRYNVDSLLLGRIMVLEALTTSLLERANKADLTLGRKHNISSGNITGTSDIIAYGNGGNVTIDEKSILFMATCTSANLKAERDINACDSTGNLTLECPFIMVKNNTGSVTCKGSLITLDNITGNITINQGEVATISNSTSNIVIDTTGVINIINTNLTGLNIKKQATVNIINCTLNGEKLMSDDNITNTGNATLMFL